MATRIVTKDNLVSEVFDDKSVVLLVGTNYTAGMVLVSRNDGKYSHTAVATDFGASVTAPALNAAAQRVLILSENCDATSAEQTAIGYTGRFNANNVTFAASQTAAALDGILQSKNIILKTWSK